MTEFYDRHGQPIGLPEWSALVRQDDYKRVAEADVGESWISTVWLGIDYGFGRGRPIIFETLVFGGPMDGQMWRYSTEEEALVGHAAAVELVRLDLAARHA